MGYFDALVATSFKTDSQGNSVFYPWGRRSGYTLPDNGTRRELESVLKRYHKGALLAISISNAMGLIIGTALLSTYETLPELTPPLVGSLLMIASGILASVCYYRWAKRVVKDLPPSSETMTRQECSQAIAQSSNYAMLWALEIVTVLFVALGVGEILLGKIVLGLIVIACGVVCGLMIGHLIVLKKK